MYGSCFTFDHHLSVNGLQSCFLVVWSYALGFKIAWKNIHGQLSLKN